MNMKTLLITFSIAGFLFALTSCSDFLERKPLPNEIMGKWQVTWIAPSVRDWLMHKGNGIHELPPEAGIEFYADGTFTATSLPYELDPTERCIVIYRRGKWELVDSTPDDDLVKWKLTVAAAGATTLSFNFHQDSEGIYLDNPIDWEIPVSVMMRKTKTLQ